MTMLTAEDMSGLSACRRFHKVHTKSLSAYNRKKLENVNKIHEKFVIKEVFSFRICFKEN